MQGKLLLNYFKLLGFELIEEIKRSSLEIENLIFRFLEMDKSKDW